MFLVGNNPATLKAFLAALGAGHGYSGRVESWLLGEKVADITFESGSVKVTGRNRERRNIGDLKVKEALWPTLPTDPLSPYGMWLKAYVDVTAGATGFPEVPVFAGPVQDADRTRWSGFVAVKAVDPFWRVNREAFEQLRPAPADQPIVDTILVLLREVYPDATLQDLTSSTATVPAGLAWNPGQGSRGRAIDELAASIGAEVFARPTEVWPAGDFVIRPLPQVTDPVAWTIPDGDASIVEDDRTVRSGAKVVNRWIGTVERPDSPPLTVTVTDDDPGSPTRYGGPMGKLVDFFSSPVIKTEAGMRVALEAKLVRSISLAAPRTITIPTNPALDAGDVLGIGVDGEDVENYIADDFGIALQHDPATMSVDARTTAEPE